MSKLFKPNHNLIVPRAYNRRNFIQQAGRGGLGAIIAAGVMPQLFLNPAYAGTAVIMSSSTDKRVELSNASFARGFSLGTWSRMRISMRIMMEGSVALTSLTPRLVFGLCSGSANQVFDASTTNFVGSRSTGATWAFNTGPDRLQLASGIICPTKRVATTWTDGTGMNSGICYLHRAGENPGSSEAFTLEIQKGSPNYTCKIFYRSATTLGAVTVDEMLTQAVATTPTISNYTWTSGQTIATDESAGTFDHVQIGWDRSEATIQIADIVLVKMAA